MENLERTAHIDAPVQRVFDYLNDPHHLETIWPQTVNIVSVEMLYGGRFTFEWIRKIFDVHFEGRGECSHSLPKDAVTYKITGGLECVIKWLLMPVDSGTEVSLQVIYTAPRPLLRHHSLTAVVRQIERDSDQMLARLKAAFEAQDEAHTAPVIHTATHH